MIESNLDDDTDENEEEALEGLVDDKAIDSSSSVGVGIAGDSFDGLLVSKTDGIIDGTSLDLSVGPALGSVDGFSLVSVLGSDDGAIVGSCVPILPSTSSSNGAIVGDSELLLFLSLSIMRRRAGTGRDGMSKSFLSTR